MDQVKYLDIFDIIAGFLFFCLPIFIGMFVILAPAVVFRKEIGLFGRVFSSSTGVLGLFLVFFWLFAALLAEQVAPFDPLQQFPELRFAAPGAIEPQSGAPFLFGGDKFGRDVFTRMIYGSRTTLTLAPAATFVAFAVGILLGMPAGYFGGGVDALLSFVANLVLAFPVIILFYLLVTPEIVETAVPAAMASVFFAFPIIFFTLLFWAWLEPRPALLALVLGVVWLAGGWLVLGVVFDADPLGLVSMEPNELNIFIAVVFASSPGVFRIVRGLTFDIRTRDYVAAAQTRGESAWYVMLWEILPNARGPLIVDACLRIGYTTILLGTLGYFGLGLIPESPDWGTTIREGSRLLRLYVHPALPPAIALMSFVLGLNLLADAVREQSLKD